MPLASDTATGVQRVSEWTAGDAQLDRAIGSVQFMFAATSDDGQFGIYVGSKARHSARDGPPRSPCRPLYSRVDPWTSTPPRYFYSAAVAHRDLLGMPAQATPRALPIITAAADARSSCTHAIGLYITATASNRIVKLSATLHEIIRLHEEVDVFGAVQLLDALEAGLARTSAGSSLTAELASAAPTLREVRARHAATLEALHLFDSDEGWAGSFEMLGSTTSFRRSTVGGGMTVRVDGVIEGVPASDLLAVWREVAHFSDWLPSCSSSRLLRMKGRVELLLHMHINVLNLLTRDAVVHGFGVDCLSTAGRMLIMGKSVTAEEMPADRNVIPEEPEWPLVRMEYRKLQVALEPLSPQRHARAS